MRSFVFLALAAMALVAIVATGGAVAQNDTETNGTVEGEIGDVRVLDSQYDADERVLEVTLENRGDSFDTVRLIEVVEAGSNSWTFQEVRLDPGETTTVVLEGIQDRGGDPAVMVASESGMADRDVHWIPTGSSLNWFNGPATWGIALLSGFSGGYGSFWGTKRYLEKQEREQEERQVEVIT